MTDPYYKDIILAITAIAVGSLLTVALFFIVWIFLP